MLASFVVSLTVIPVLCSLLLRPKPGAAMVTASLCAVLKRVVRGTFLKAALRSVARSRGSRALLIGALML
jgi:multidrug efflux pump subunit AcrB